MIRINYFGCVFIVTFCFGILYFGVCYWRLSSFNSFRNRMDNPTNCAVFKTLLSSDDVQEGDSIVDASSIGLSKEKSVGIYRWSNSEVLMELGGGFYHYGYQLRDGVHRVEGRLLECKELYSYREDDGFTLIEVFTKEAILFDHTYYWRSRCEGIRTSIFPISLGPDYGV